MGGQEPPRPSAGCTAAVVHHVQCGGQLQRKAVVGGEPVGGELGLPADRGVGQGAAREATEAPMVSTGGRLKAT